MSHVIVLLCWRLNIHLQFMLHLVHRRNATATDRVHCYAATMNVRRSICHVIKVYLLLRGDV